MQWSRELRVAGRGLRTAMRAASAIAKTQMNAPLRRSGAVVTSRMAPAGLAEWNGFGSNPGRLAMLVYTPARSPQPGTPLIVLLHGCGQAAVDFAEEAGWFSLADRIGVPLVLPEQSDGNNRGRCFNWFRPIHVSRGMGEGQSIRQMVEAAARQFDADRERVFVAGLSAGGAMAAALLAAYPDVFVAGAVVAGLPVGAASGAAQALARMAQAGPDRSADAWGAIVHHAAPLNYSGPWPRVSIWHGEEDATVDPANGRLLATQWAAVHGVTETATATRTPAGAKHELWGAPGARSVELWTLPGEGHVWPQEATRRIAEFWDLRSR